MSRHKELTDLVWEFVHERSKTTTPFAQPRPPYVYRHIHTKKHLYSWDSPYVPQPKAANPTQYTLFPQPNAPLKHTLKSRLFAGQDIGMITDAIGD